MRDIKFRVWDRAQNQFWDRKNNKGFLNVSLCLDSGNPLFWTGDSVRNEGDLWLNEWVVQQFTGLKDKNENIICEGDVIKWEKGWMHSEMIGSIEWIENGFYFISSKGDIKVQWRLSYLNKNAEIIGNIFEYKYE